MVEEGGADAAPQDDPETHGAAADSGGPPPPSETIAEGGSDLDMLGPPSAGAGSAPTSSAVPSGTPSADDVQAMVSTAVAAATQQQMQQMHRAFESRHAAEKAANDDKVAVLSLEVQRLQNQVAQERQQRAADAPAAREFHDAAKALAERYGRERMAQVLQGARPSSLKYEHQIVRAYNEELLEVWKDFAVAARQNDHDYWFRALERTFDKLYLAAIQLSMITWSGEEKTLWESAQDGSDKKIFLVQGVLKGTWPSSPAGEEESTGTESTIDTRGRSAVVSLSQRLVQEQLYSGSWVGKVRTSVGYAKWTRGTEGTQLIGAFDKLLHVLTKSSIVEAASKFDKMLEVFCRELWAVQDAHAASAHNLLLKTEHAGPGQEAKEQPSAFLQRLERLIDCANRHSHEKWHFESTELTSPTGVFARKLHRELYSFLMSRHNLNHNEWMATPQGLKWVPAKQWKGIDADVDELNGIWAALLECGRVRLHSESGPAPARGPPARGQPKVRRASTAQVNAQQATGTAWPPRSQDREVQNAAREKMLKEYGSRQHIKHNGREHEGLRKPKKSLESLGAEEIKKVIQVNLDSGLCAICNGLHVARDCDAQTKAKDWYKQFGAPLMAVRFPNGKRGPGGGH